MAYAPTKALKKTSEAIVHVPVRLQLHLANEDFAQGKTPYQNIDLFGTSHVVPRPRARTHGATIDIQSDSEDLNSTSEAHQPAERVL